MTELYKIGNDTYYKEPLLDAIMYAAANGLHKSINKTLFDWEYKHLTQNKSIVQCGESCIVTLQTPTGEVKIKLKATFIK